MQDVALSAPSFLGYTQTCLLPFSNFFKRVFEMHRANGQLLGMRASVFLLSLPSLVGDEPLAVCSLTAQFLLFFTHADVFAVPCCTQTCGDTTGGLSAVANS